MLCWKWLDVEASAFEQTDAGHLCVLVSGTDQFSIMVAVKAEWKPGISR